VKRLRRWLKRIGLGVVVLLVLLVVAWFFRWELLGGPVRDIVRDALAEQGLRIHVDEFSGSLVTDVTATGIRTEALTDTPFLREGSIARVHVTYSLAGLLWGRDDWLGDVEVEGLTAVVDLEAPFPDAPGSDPAPGGPTILPRRVSLEGANLTILAGPDRLDAADVDFAGRLFSAREIAGTMAAGRVRAVVDGREHDLGSPSATLDLDGEKLRILARSDDSGPIREIVTADLSRLDRGLLDGTLDIPAFGGRIRGTIVYDLDEETVTANLTVADLRPRPLLRFLSGHEADLELVSGNLNATFRGIETPWWKTLTGGFDLTVTAPTVRRWSAERIEVKGTFADEVFTVTAGRTIDPAGAFHGQLTLGESPRLDARLDIEDLDLGDLGLAVGGRDVRGVVTGFARIRGPFSAPELGFDLEVGEPGFGEWSADRAWVAAPRVTLTSAQGRLDVQRGEDRVNLNGTLDYGDGLTFDALAEVNVKKAAALAALFDVEFPANLDPSLFVSLEAKSSKDGGAAVKVYELNVGTALGRLSGKSLIVFLPSFGDFDWRDVLVRGTLSLADLSPQVFAGRFDLPDVAAGALAAEIEVEGKLRDPVAKLTLSGERIRLSPPERDPVTADRVRVAAEYSGGRLLLTELFVGGSAWRLTASGRLWWNPLAAEPGPIGAAALTGRADLIDVPLELTGRIPGIAVATGRVSAAVEVGGSIDAPRALGTLAVTAKEIRPEDEDIPSFTDVDLRVRMTEADTAGVHVVVEPSRATVLGATVAIESASTYLSYEGFRISDPRLRASVEGIDVGRLARRYGGIDTLGGIVDLTEISLTAGPAIVVAVAGRDLRYEGDREIGPVGDPGTLDLRAEWRDGRLLVENARATKGVVQLDIDADIPIGLSLDPLAIHRPPDGEIHVTAKGHRIDLAPLATIFALPEDIRLGGSADFEIVLGGTHERPRQEIRATVRDGFFRVPGLAALDDIGGDLRFTGKGTLHVDRLEALLGRGKIAIAPGSYVRTTMGGEGPLSIADMKLRLTGKNVLLARQRRLLIRGTPDLTLSGNEEKGYLLSGSLDLTSFRYTQRLELVSRQPSLAPLPLTENPFLRRLRLDLELSAPPESIRIRNNLMDAELGGRLRIFGTAAVPRPEGRIIADRGTVRLPALTMRLIHASVEFRRERPLQPRIDTRLATSVDRVTVYLSAKGPLNNLEIDTSSMPALPEEDVITLLATGELPANVDTAASAAGVAANLLYRQIVAEMSGADPDSETTAIEDLAGRVEEISVDTASLFGGGGTAWRATVRIIDDWLYLRADQTDAFNFGLDILFRLSFR